MMGERSVILYTIEYIRICLRSYTGRNDLSSGSTMLALHLQRADHCSTRSAKIYAQVHIDMQGRGWTQIGVSVNHIRLNQSIG